MSEKIYDTLKKLEYLSIDQFLEDINRNFAIVQNSPLYKGIPGKTPLPGEDGPEGTRGSSFIFINFDRFTENFPNELVMGSDVNLSYINSKLTNQEDREKLFLTFNIDKIVDKDVVVMTDSTMLSYDEKLDTFVYTGLAFNQSNNLEANIHTIIEGYVRSYIGQNETINSVANIMSSFTTYGKNYADNNSSFSTSQILNTTVYSPFISGYNKQSGVLIDNHKYIGFSDAYFPMSDNGTLVIGNMKKYYQLLMGTISTDSNQTLTSDYAPGVGNIPSLVLLQDTYNNGILIGHKGKSNLKRFGSIFKNNSDDLVIKSDSGILSSEFGELKINRQYLKFDKLVQFGDSLEVSRNFTLFGEYNGKHIRSGLNTTTRGANRLDLGSTASGSEVVIVSNDLYLTNNRSRVLVTDSNGKVSKSYQVETSQINSNDLVNLNILQNLPNSQTNIVTSNYLYVFGTKINNIANYVNQNYWTKAQFNSNIIPNLYLTNQLVVAKRITIGESSLDSDSGIFTLKGSTTILDTTTVRLNNYKNKVLVTDANGVIINRFVVSTTNGISFSNTTGLFTIPTAPTQYSEILSNQNLHLIYTDINRISSWIKSTYWNKTEFESNVIPTLRLTTLIQSPNITITNYLTTGNNTLRIGYGTNYDTSIESTNIRFTKFQSTVLVTNENGTIVNKHKIFTGTVAVRYTASANSLTNTPTFSITSSDTSTRSKDEDVMTYTFLNQLASHTDNIVNWTDSTYWRKGHWNSGSIPSLTLNTSLVVNGTAVLGGNSLTGNAGIIINGNLITLGKESGTGGNSETIIRGQRIRYPNRNNKVLVTDSTGYLDDRYILESSTPQSSDTSGVSDWFNHAIIKSKYWAKGVTQNFINYPSSATSILTSKYLDWIVGNFKAIRELLYDRPTYAEINNNIPIGVIVMWDMKLNTNIPANFVICDGRQIPGTNLYTTNMINRTVRFVNSNPGGLGGNDTINLSVDQLPRHKFSGTTQANGEHDHFTVVNQDGGNFNEYSGQGVIRRWRNGSDGSSYTLMLTRNGWAPTLGNTSRNGSHQHWFETNELGQGHGINIEPANVRLIPIMRYK